MNASRKLFVLALILPAIALAQQPQQLPRVKILATGGTIAGAQPKPGDVGYKAGAYDVNVLIKAVPGLDKLANVSGEQVASIGSQDMNDEVWIKLGRRVNQVLANPEVDAVVITHGTDTMEETGYFLNLVVNSAKPVVLVGSMRPATAISADGPMNLFNAVAAAIDPQARGRGVLVVLNDQIHFARETTKTNTTSLDTFVSPNRGLAGFVLFGKARWFSKPEWKHTAGSEFAGLIPDSLPRVEIVYSYANAGPDFVNAAVAGGAQGIVLAGVGDGNATQPVIDALAAAAKKGIVVVRTSRTNSGAVARNVEVDDDKLGFVAGQELNAQKARVLLQLGLLKGRDAKAIQALFEKY